MKYIIIEDDDTEKIIEKVNKFLANGWELYGNLCMSITESSLSPFKKLFVQAMIKN